MRPRRLKLGTRTVGRCMVYTWIRLLLLIRPFISSFFFLQFLNIKRFRHTLLRNCEAWKVDTWYTRGQWADVSCIPESGCCCLFVPLFLHFSFSNFQILKFFDTLFLGTVRPRRLKLGTHVDSGQTYHVYRNQAAAPYSSLHFFSFLSLQFSNIKNFCCTFFRNCVAYKVETWYTHGQWEDVSCIPQSGCCFLFVPYFSISPMFKN